MKTIAIITLNGYFNYGNRLQNFALQHILEELGFSVETIIIQNDDKNLKPQKTAQSFTTKLKNNKDFNVLLRKVYYRLWSNIYKKEINKSNKIRTEVFKKFTFDYIKETDHYISDNNILNNLTDKYDYFIVGSDQVWNPKYNNGSPIYFLTFAEKNKRIAYAPSFGVSEIHPEFITEYKRWISEIHRLSVRENDGAKIIRDLTGREAPVLVDPTLLLPKEKWMSISKPAPNRPKEKYMLTYFLGGIPEKYKKKIKKIAYKYKLGIINLGDKRETVTYRTGPSEFIDYINGCSLLCTDSFHGTVFSILFEKPFIVYDRIGANSMYSRINTLLEKFDLNSRKAENIVSDNNLLEINFSHVPSILEAERKKAMDYLKNALHVKDD